MITSKTKFVHSIRVPRIYKIASKIAKEHSEGNGSIKQLLYQNRKKHPNLKAILSLVSTLFARAHVLEGLLKRSNFLLKEPHCDPWLIKVLTVELLWGKGRLVGKSKPEATVRAYEQVFKAHLSDYKDLPDDTARHEGTWKPRYVRVNTLKCQFEEAVKNFQDDGWELLELSDTSYYEDFLTKVSKLEKGQFLIDIHIPNLLVFPPKTEFYNHPAYKKRSIILQDKASCIPVHLLSPPPGSVVLDMCAAPGMKTTHLAAVLGNKGKIHALERNPSRFEVLMNILESSGATCVEAVNRDALSFSQQDFPNVEYIIVDPSCTGSGMAGRDLNQDKLNISRLKSLTGFQIKILRSALSKYPKVKRVVYSTCSIYPEENEEVVREVLETNYRFKLVPVKKFLDKGWRNFGSGDIGKLCLYAKPDVDFTDGFFTAVFERLEEGETNQFFNEKVYDLKMKIQYEKSNDNVDKNVSGNKKSSVAHEEVDPEIKQYEIKEEVVFQVDESCSKIGNSTNDTLKTTTGGENVVTARREYSGNEPRKKKNKSKKAFTEFDTNSNVHKEEVTGDLAPRISNSFKKKKKGNKELGNPFVIQSLEKSDLKLEAHKEEVLDGVEPRVTNSSKKMSRSKEQSFEKSQSPFIIQLEKILDKVKLKVEPCNDEFEPRITNTSKKRNTASKDQSCEKPQDPFITQLENGSENLKLKVEVYKKDVPDEFKSRILNISKKKEKDRKDESYVEPQNPFIIQLQRNSKNPKVKVEAEHEVPDEFEPGVTNSSKKIKRTSKEQSCEKPQDPFIIQLEKILDKAKLKVNKETCESQEGYLITADDENMSTKKKKRKSSNIVDKSEVKDGCFVEKSDCEKTKKKMKSMTAEEMFVQK